MGNYFNELRWKIIRANNLLQLIHQVTIEFKPKLDWTLLEPWIVFYQSPLILTELFQHNLINVSYLTACYLYQVMMTLHFLNDGTNDAESTQK